MGQKIQSKEIATPREIFGSPDLESTLNNIKGQKFMDYVNVKDFGAKGDGVTDDTQAFLNALDNNITLFIPKGEYNVSEIDFSGYNNLSIIGEGKKSHIFNNNIDENVFYCYDNTQNNLIIDNCFIESSQTSDTESVSPIYIRDFNENLTIKNCFLTGHCNDGSGIRIDNAKNVRITNNNIWGGIGSNITSAINCYSNVENVFINNNICDGNNNQVSQGIFAQNYEKTIITNNITKNFQRHGIEYYNSTGGKEVIISNNISFNNVWSGIYCYNEAHKTIISNNIIFNNGKDDGNTGGPPRGNIIAGLPNDVNSEETILITGNYCYDTWDMGVYVLPVASIQIVGSGVTVTGNTIIQKNTKHHGVVARKAGIDRITISNNKIYINDGTAISAMFNYGNTSTWLSTQVNNNDIFINSGVGIKSGDGNGNSHSLMISNNKIDGKNRTTDSLGILITDTLDAVISNNYVTGFDRSIKEDSECANNVFKNNVSKNNNSKHALLGTSTVDDGNI